jgi:uncharacterized protein YggU (UPF0235/DUF167 family)
MKRSDILSLLVGMDSEKAKDACDAILNLHNAEMEDAKTRVDYTGYVKKEDYDKIAAENKALKDGSEKYKDYDELAKFKADTLANQTNAKKISAIEALLRQNNANEKVIKLLAKSVDLSKVELDEKGEIKDSKSIIDSLKSDNANCSRVPPLQEQLLPLLRKTIMARPLPKNSLPRWAIMNG